MFSGLLDKNIHWSNRPGRLWFIQGFLVVFLDITAVSSHLFINTMCLKVLAWTQVGTFHYIYSKEVGVASVDIWFSLFHQNKAKKKSLKIHVHFQIELLCNGFPHFYFCKSPGLRLRSSYYPAIYLPVVSGRALSHPDWHTAAVNPLWVKLWPRLSIAGLSYGLMFHRRALIHRLTANPPLGW